MIDERDIRQRLLARAPSPELDDFAGLVARVLGVPMCAVSIEGDGRYWFRGRYGLPVADIGENESLCSNVLRTRRLFTIPDLADSPIFREHPLAIGPLRIRFFAGAPMRFGEDVLMGSLCVSDVEGREFTPAEIETLERFAEVGAALLQGYLAVGDAVEAAVALDERNRLLEIRQDELDAAAKRFAHAARTDSLTGLPNRVPYLERLEASLSGEARIGLVLVDADSLKTVNDTLGHAFGDELIRTLGARCVNAASDAGSVFRLAGDEFAVLVDDCGENRLRAVAEAIVAACREPFHWQGHSLVPEASVGAALGEPGLSVETLRQNADLALYHAKATNRGGRVVFHEGLRTAIMRRLQWVRRLDEALCDGRILAYYQPVVRLDTGEIVGLEALARLEDTDGRIVAAGEFQDALADAKVGHRLTTQLLEAVAADIRRWLDCGIPFQHVGINVTTADFQRGDLEARIALAFGRWRVPLDHVVLEITETVSMEGTDGNVARTALALRAKGIRIALDDFGTGFASLTQLIGFPVDVIKIDRSFVGRMLSDPSARAVVEALVGLAGKLDMRVVAEGIETEEQAAALRSMGCRLGQGFLFARPGPASTTTTLLEAFGQKMGASSVATVEPSRLSAAS